MHSNVASEGHKHLSSGKLPGDSNVNVTQCMWYIDILFLKLVSTRKQPVHCYATATVFSHDAELVTAVPTVKAHSAAATYWIRLRILTACQILPIIYNGRGDVAPKLLIPLWDPDPRLIHGSLAPPNSIAPNGIPSCSGFFVWLMFVTNRQTDTNTRQHRW